MTLQEYKTKLKNFDRDMMQKKVNLIPKNINRAGKLYRKLLKNLIHA